MENVDPHCRPARDRRLSRQWSQVAYQLLFQNSRQRLLVWVGQSTARGGTLLLLTVRLAAP